MTIKTYLTASLLLASPLAFATVAGAQTAQLDVKSDDPLAGGFLDLIRHAGGVDASGIASFHGILTFVGGSSTPAVFQGSQLLVDGQSVFSRPAGAQLALVDDLQSAGPGQVFLNAIVATAPTNQVFAVSLNTKTILSADDPVYGPFGPGARYARVDQIASSGTAERLLLRAWVGENGVSQSVVQVLELDAQGEVVGETTYVDPDARLAPFCDDSLFCHEPALALNAHGDALYTFDHTTFADAIYFNDEEIAAAGDPSPIIGRSWEWFSGGDINDAGDIVFVAGLNDGTSVLATPTDILARVGDPVPGGSFTRAIQALDHVSGPPALTPDGEVVYAAYVSSLLNIDDVLLFGDEVIFEPGVTPVLGGRSFQSGFPAHTLEAFHLSPNGRFVSVKTRLADLSNALVTIDLGRVQRLEGCATNAGSLTREQGFAVAGATVTLGFDDAQEPGALPYLLVSDDTLTGFPPCGLPLAAGELLIDVSATNPFLVVPAAAWNGTSVALDLPIDANPLLIDQTVFAQGVFLSPGAAEPVRLTNALEIQIGA